MKIEINITRGTSTKHSIKEMTPPSVKDLTKKLKAKAPSIKDRLKAKAHSANTYARTHIKAWAETL